MAMTAKEALTKIVGDAGEFAVCLALLMALIDADQEEISLISRPLFRAFARSHGIDVREVGELMHALLGVLARESWAYVILCPSGWSSDMTDAAAALGRKLAVKLESNTEIRRILEEGLASYSFDP